MKTLRVIGECCLVFLTIIALCVSLAFVYYRYFVDDTTLGVNYIDNQVGLDIEEVLKSEDLSEEERNELEDRYFIEVNYYSNEKKNGIELQELQLNYFTDFSLNSSGYRSSGMQYIGNYQGLPLDTWDNNSEITFMNFSGSNDRYYGTSEVCENIANSYFDKSFNYYDTTLDLSWSGVTNENGSISTNFTRTTDFIIKIDNRAFAIRLDKFFDKDVGDVRNIFGIGWKIGEKYNRFYYTYGSLFQTCINAVKKCSVDNGTYYIVVDLSSLFTIKEYDMEAKKFKSDDVTDVIKNYAVMKFTISENGAKNANQSIFNMINYDSKFGIYNEEVNTSYWQERYVYNLDETNMTYRYSEVYNGYFISLNMDTKKLFADMPRCKVNISLDLTNDYYIENDINIVGIDYNGFEDFEIDTLTISGNQQKLYLLEKALYNTNLQTLKYSNGITFDFGINATNNTYVEVVI